MSHYKTCFCGKKKKFRDKDHFNLSRELNIISRGPFLIIEEGILDLHQGSGS